MMKSNNKSKNIFLKFFVVLFILIYVYFASFTFRYSYVGISSDYKDGTWVIRNIHNGGEASLSNLSVGDEILEIDHQDSRKNFLLNKMLIVEQATSITVLHQHKKINVLFKDSGTRSNFFIFSILSLILLFLSAMYFKKHEISKTSQRYSIFLFLTSLFLVSIIPSSMGDVIARSILIFYVTIFPLFIDMFWRAASLKEGVTKLSIMSKIIMGYSFMTTVLFIYSYFFDVPLYLTKYLSRYIFYINLVFLIFLLILAFYSSIKGKTLAKLNTVFSVLIGWFPVFIGYIFPLYQEVSVIYTIPFLIFPIMTMINDLITNRLTNIRINLPNFVVYVLISLIITVDVFCLYFLVQFLSIWLVMIYTFLLIFSSLPILKDLLILNSKKEYQLLDNHSIFSAVETEREEISIYLHDTIIQDVIYYKRQIDDLEFIPQNKVQEVLDDVIFELRELCSNIYPLMIKELGLKNAIHDIVDKFQKKESVIITVDINVDRFDFENKVANFILRSIREVINNSIIHGNAKNIKLKIYSFEKMIIIEIIDDGYFEITNETSSSHFGLNVISEKLFLLGGELTITKNPTTIKMFLPNQ